MGRRRITDKTNQDCSDESEAEVVVTKKAKKQVKEDNQGKI